LVELTFAKLATRNTTQKNVLEMVLPQHHWSGLFTEYQY